MSPVTVAAVQVAPSPARLTAEPVAANSGRAASMIRWHAGTLLGDGATSFRYGDSKSGNGS